MRACLLQTESGRSYLVRHWVLGWAWASPPARPLVMLGATCPKHARVQAWALSRQPTCDLYEIPVGYSFYFLIKPKNLDVKTTPTPFATSFSMWHLNHLMPHPSSHFLLFLFVQYSYAIILFFFMFTSMNFTFYKFEKKNC